MLRHDEGWPATAQMVNLAASNLTSGNPTLIAPLALLARTVPGPVAISTNVPQHSLLHAGQPYGTPGTKLPLKLQSEVHQPLWTRPTSNRLRSRAPSS